MKNKALKKINNEQLCKLHNVKKRDSYKIKLSMSKSHNCIKTYHPLKNKKIKLHRLGFIKNESINDCAFFSERKNADGYNILSKRYSCTVNFQVKKRTIWVSEDIVLEWLISVGVNIKRAAMREFVLQNRICSLNHVLVFANKKRIEMGLEPFYIEGLTEC